MKWEIWDDSDELGTSYSCFPVSSVSAAACMNPNAKLLHTFEASSWNEAMTKQNELMDWGPYTTPLEEDIFYDKG